MTPRHSRSSCRSARSGAVSPSLKADAAARKRSISSEATSGVCHHRLPHAGGESVDGQWKMLTARAATSRMVTEEMADSLSMSSFAQRVRGMAAVGLNAIEFVKETYM